MVRKSPRQNPRLCAIETLANVLDKGQNLSDADSATGLADGRDRALARHLAYGVCRWLNTLEWLSSQLLRKALKNRDRDIHRLILIGLFQLRHDGTAPHAAINETAECARLAGKTWAVAVINAVLRRFQRDRQQWLNQLENQPERFAHPAWLLQEIQANWPDDWQEIMQANNQAAPLWLRINRTRQVQNNLTSLLSSAGFTVVKHPSAPDAIKLSPPAPVAGIPGFSTGLVSVQDPAAQLAADLLELEDHLRVLDACAAPGGKTCHILERFPTIELTAVELNESRLALVRENLDRLGLARRAGLKLLTGDAADPSSWWDGARYQRILLDAPCTATGVIRRHPEIKWLRTTQQLEKAVRTQARLLQQLWPLLAPGGILVYATCSILADENNRQISRFLAEHADAEVLPLGVKWGRKQDFGRQILPGEEEMDGFYYARMRKTA
ncbi:MAG: 16S rRNA (cytosine(967)-C(5))-methyltransferase RsmB [Xanthomonadales bacterium]